ncbi:hypothetical protein Hanom_Chr12g01153591 [Helianthus anomalus]
MLKNKEILKQKIEKLTLKCQNFEKENEILRQMCTTKCEGCVEKDNKFQDFQKEYDNLKWSSPRVQETYDTLKKQVKCFDERLSETLTTKGFMREKLKKYNKN